MRKNGLVLYEPSRGRIELNLNRDYLKIKPILHHKNNLLMDTQINAIIRKVWGNTKFDILFCYYTLWHK